MLQSVLTRKNLIAVSIAAFYAVVLVFTGVCLDGDTTMVSRRNPIALIAGEIGFKTISPGTMGLIALILVAFYTVVLVTALIYERRYAIVNNIKPTSGKMWAVYGGTIAACLVLSLGLGILIQHPLTGENIGTMLLYLGQSLSLSFFVFAALVLVVGALIMFIINFINIDKPFKCFDDANQPVFDDDDLDLNADVKASFDTEELENSMPGFGPGGGAGAGVGGGAGVGEGGETVVKSAESLDDREKVFPTLCRIDNEYEGFDTEAVKSDELTLEEICTKFRNYLAKEERLYFDIDTIRFFISGFAASHFEILEGLSGTGKSSLPRYFAKFANAEVLFMPVQATWRDKTSILGFFNEFSKTYTETEFLAALYRANYNPDRLQFFVLDEMNISRVEYYFADLLSVLEYPQDQWKLKIMNVPYDFIPPFKLEDGKIQIPANSYFVGTANKDDSTFTITDKVYDRAITMEFLDKNAPFAVFEDTGKITLSASKLHSLYRQAMSDPTSVMLQSDFVKLNTVCDYVYDKFGIAIGNRIINQITNIVPVFVACGGTKETAIDFMISKKLVSKIEGRFEEYVKDALRGLLDLLSATYGTGVMALTERTANNIIKTL
ncbi:MAG: hypothetical protein IJ459_01525 [Clostridia bacterium]|nr:hypothetical protein [Clostridia bacterium]